ncbi:MAG: hypothetical protein V3R29_06175 [Candidatus Acidoferrales bacterium]
MPDAETQLQLIKAIFRLIVLCGSLAAGVVLVSCATLILVEWLNGRAPRQRSNTHAGWH